MKKHSRRAAKKERKHKGTKAYRKGSKSKTMKGKKDFTTKKSSKVFNRRRHYQKHAKGSRVNRRPYAKKGGTTEWLLPLGGAFTTQHTRVNAGVFGSYDSNSPGGKATASTVLIPAGLSGTGKAITEGDLENAAKKHAKSKAAAEHRLHEEGLNVKPHGTRLKYVPKQFW